MTILNGPAGIVLNVEPWGPRTLSPVNW